MLELDGRIKDRNAIKSVIDVDKNFVGKTGYFADYLSELSDLKRCYHGTITDVIESGETNFCFKYDYCGESSDSIYFVADEDLLPVEEEYRPFTLEEFVNKFDVGDIVCFRRKSELNDKGYAPSIKTLVVSIDYDNNNDGDYWICMYNRWWTLKSLFKECELWDKKLGWIPFGVKTNG